MIRYSLLLFTLLLAFSCNSKSDKKELNADMVKNPSSGQGDDKNVDMPEITFFAENSDNPQYFDFGVIIQGEVVVHTFNFKNTGDDDLIIRSTSSTCGCTVSSFSKEPIKPGDKGKVDVTFSSAGRKGRQRKAVTVLTNAQPSSKKLILEANVVVPN